MNVVPRRLPVVQRFDVLNRNVCLRFVTDNGRNYLVLRLDLRRFVGRIVQHQTIAVAEDVMADPTQNAPIARCEHRREHRLQKRFAGLSVFASHGRFLFDGQFLNGGERCAKRWRKVHVGEAQIDSGPGV